MLNVTTWTPINFLFFKTREFRESSPDSLFKDNFMNLLVIYVKFVAQLGRKPFVATL